jgi:hypothetical protein
MTTFAIAQRPEYIAFACAAHLINDNGEVLLASSPRKQASMKATWMPIGTLQTLSATCTKWIARAFHWKPTLPNAKTSVNKKSEKNKARLFFEWWNARGSPL